MTVGGFIDFPSFPDLSGGIGTNTPPVGTPFPNSGGRYLSYHGGDGNDIVLSTVVPEPASFVLLALGSLALCGRRRRG